MEPFKPLSPFGGFTAFMSADKIDDSVAEPVDRKKRLDDVMRQLTQLRNNSAAAKRNQLNMTWPMGTHFKGR